MTYPTRQRSPGRPHGGRLARRLAGLSCHMCDGAAQRHPRSCRHDCHSRRSLLRYDFSNVEVRLPDGTLFPHQAEVSYDDQVDACRVPKVVTLSPKHSGLIEFHDGGAVRIDHFELVAAEDIEPGQLVAVDQEGLARPAPKYPRITGKGRDLTPEEVAAIEEEEAQRRAVGPWVPPVEHACPRCGRQVDGVAHYQIGKPTHTPCGCSISKEEANAWGQKNRGRDLFRIERAPAADLVVVEALRSLSDAELAKVPVVSDEALERALAQGQAEAAAFRGEYVAVGEFVMPERQDAGDVAQGLTRDQVDRALHPNGRCTCAGEGHCDWCQLHEQLNPDEEA